MATYTILGRTPQRYIANPGTTSTPTTTLSSQEFDVAFQGLGFRLSNLPEKPIVRQMAQLERNRIDQAQEAGEQTLTNWWIRAQSSFHGGAGLVNLEPEFPFATDRIRYLTSKNLNVWTPGHLTVLPGVRMVDTSPGIHALTLAAGTPNSPTASAVPTIFYLVGSTIKKAVINGAGADTITAFACPNGETPLSMVTDGSQVFVASAQRVYRMTYAGGFTELYTTPAGTATTVLSWIKDRLMASCNNALFQLNGSKTTGTSLIGAGELIYTHPNPNIAWGRMSQSPRAIIAPGWDGSVSILYQIVIDASGSTPVLHAGGVIAALPPGERITGLVSALGSYLGMSTTAGIRVGTFEAYQGFLTYGPLSCTGYFTDIATTDRYLYAHTALAPDEPGLVRLDLGLQVDQAGRYAWAPDQISPVARVGSPDSTGEITFDPAAGNTYWANAAGLHQASAANPQSRSGFMQTANIRFGTTEPKLFKLGRVRGTFINGSISVVGSDAQGNAHALVSYQGGMDPGEFQLLNGTVELLQLTFTLTAGADLTRYQTKALPGTPRQETIQVVVACYDQESTRSGQEVIQRGTGRPRYNALRALALAGDQITFQEFTEVGVVNTTVVIDQFEFSQIGRPTKTQYFGGDITVAMRTVA